MTVVQLELPFESSTADGLHHDIRMLAWGCRSCEHFVEREFLSETRGIDGFILCMYERKILDLTALDRCPGRPVQGELFD